MNKKQLEVGIKSILKRGGLLPVNKQLWNTFEVNHIKGNEDKKRGVRNFIRGEVNDLSGIYVCKNKSRRVLYVGKGNPLRNRLYMHYLASFEPVPGDTQSERWHRFWSAHKGKLIVYWKEVKNRRDQKIIEHMLEYILKPKFSNFK